MLPCVSQNRTDCPSSHRILVSSHPFLPPGIGSQNGDLQSWSLWNLGYFSPGDMELPCPDRRVHCFCREEPGEILLTFNSVDLNIFIKYLSLYGLFTSTFYERELPCSNIILSETSGLCNQTAEWRSLVLNDPSELCICCPWDSDVVKLALHILVRVTVL